MYLCEHHFNKAECMFDARVTCNVFSIIFSEQYIHSMLLLHKVSYKIPYLILRIFYCCTLVRKFSPIWGEFGINAAFLRHATLKEIIIWVVEITFLVF